MKHLFVTSLVILAACGALFAKGPHVPGPFQGTTEITVANAWDHEICVFNMTTTGAAANDNWLGDASKQQPIAPGANRTFAIKPGVYHVIGAFCDHGQFVAASGNYGSATTNIQGPTVLALGPKQVEPVAGAQTLSFPKLYTQPASSGGDSGGASEPAAEEPAAAESSPSPSSSSSSEAPAPKGPQCLAHGAVCSSETAACCAGMTCASRTKFSDGSLGNGYCE